MAALLAGACGLWATTAVADPVPQGTVQRVNPDIAGDQYVAGTAMAPDGHFAVAYADKQSTGPTNVFVRLFATDGTPAAGTIPVNPDTADRSTPSVAMDAAGNMVVAYTYSSSFVESVRAQRFDAFGSPVGGELIVSATGGRQLPRVAMAPNGRFVVVWEHAPDIEARAYAADGTPVAAAFVLASNLSRFPDVAADSSGRFVVVWKRSTVFGATGVVPARRIAATGTPDGSEFDALTGDLNQTYDDPAVGLADDGRFTVVARGSVASTGSASVGIVAQRVTAGNGSDGPIFRVDDNPGASLLQPAAAMDSDGDLLVAFEDQTGGGEKLYLRHYLPDKTADGGPVLIGAGGSTNPHARIAVDGAGRLAAGFTSVDGGGASQIGAFTRRVNYAAITDPPPPPPPPVPTTSTTVAAAEPPLTMAATSPPPPTVAPPAAAPLPAFTAVVTLPTTKKCVSRRRFRIRVRKQHGVNLTSAEVKVNGKRVKVVRGKRLTAPIDLRTLPKGRFTVQIIATTSDGRKIKGTRKYRTCAKKRRGTLKKPL